MLGWLSRKSAKTLRKSSRPATARPNLEQLEDRVTPAAMTPYEVHALQVINYARTNPAAFGQDLKNLYLGSASYTSPMGYKGNDPVWADLRNEIASAERRTGSTWRSGFTTTGPNTFLTYISTLPVLPPIVWNSSLQDGAIGHNAWMATYFFTHSVFSPGQPPPPGETPQNAIPGIPRNFNVSAGDYFNTTGLSSAGENIGYAFAVLPATLNAYRTGQISLDGFYDRLVYADIIAFVMEYYNGSTTSPWGHLNNLLGNPANPSSYFTMMGLSNRIYENSLEPEKGTPQSYFSTHRFGSQAGQSWANVIVYEDVNGNNFYDAGEGRPATISYASNVSGGSDSGNTLLDATGYTTVSLKSPYTQYTFNATYLGTALTPLTVNRDGTNKSVIFKYVKPATPVLTGLRSSDITFGADGAWWAMDGNTGVTKKLAQWTPTSAANWQFANTGDFNADGRTDVIAYSRGQWWVGLQTVTGFVTSLWTGWAGTATWVDVNIADMNGDGASDIVARFQQTGQWWVARSNGANGFNNASIGAWSPGAGWRDTQVGDLNNDGLADIVSRTSTGQWWAGISSGGTALLTSLWTTWSEAAGWRNVQKADVNGDGRIDLVGRTSAGAWWASLSTGTGFTTSYWGQWTESAGWNTVLVGDFNGDGKVDIVGRENSGNTWVALSNGTRFTTTLWGVFSASVPWGNFHVGDTDGDGRSDFIGRTGTTWWVGAGASTAFVNRIMGNLALTYVFAKVGRVESAIYNS
jgi:hypothetical protein